MKTLKALLHLNHLPHITLVFFAVLCLLCLRTDGASVFLGVQPTIIPGEVNYAAFSRWLLYMSVPILVNGYFLSKSQRLRLFICLRLGNWTKWFGALLIVCIVNSLIWSLGSWVALLITAQPHEVIPAGLLLLVSNALWSVITTLVFFLSRRASWSGVVVIMALGLTFLPGEYIPYIRPYLPGNWGMLQRSAEYLEGGTTIGLMALLSFAVLSVLVIVYVFMAHKGQFKEV